MASLPRLLEELKRRRVYRVAGVYCVAGWAVVQVAATVQPFLALSPRFVTGVIVAVALGFPVVVGLAWAFDVTPEGIRRTPSLPSSPDEPAGAGPRLRWLPAVLVLAVLLLASIGLTALRGRMQSTGARTSTATPAVAVSPAAELASIAVLPFQNLSADKGNEYFSDGITDEILTNLAAVAGVRVISHTSVMQYRNTQKPIGQIARELGVATVLEGSVQQAGGRVRIEAQLIDARSDRHLWADRYDRELKDVFAVESDVAQKITQALQARLTPAEHDRMMAQPTENAAAHQLYLQGRALWYNENEADMRKAAALFQRALELDPSYALAYSGLADVHFDLARYRDRPANLARAREYAQRAVALDSTLGEPYDVLGIIAAYVDYDWRTAEAQLRRSIAMKPGYTVAHYDLATFLSYRGRHDEALAEARTAARLDPLTWWAALAPAEVLIPAGRCAEALAAAREASARLAETFRTHEMLAMAYRCQGNLAAAAAELRTGIRLAPDESVNDRALLAIIELAQGKRADAERTYAELSSLESGSKVWKAALAAQLGKTAEALQLLEGAYDDRAIALAGIDQDPALAPLRGEPRFQAIERKVGLLR